MLRAASDVAGTAYAQQAATTANKTDSRAQVIHCRSAFFGDIEDAEKLFECCKKHKGLIYAMFETAATCIPP